jgi:hypothetical protein
VPLPPAGSPIPDTPFPQETHQPLPRHADAAANDVRAVTITADGRTWIATPVGLFTLEPDGGSWRSPPSSIGAGPVFCLVPDGVQLYVGAWNGLHRGDHHGLRRVAGIEGPVSAAALVPGGGAGGAAGAVALGPDGCWQLDGAGRVRPQSWRVSRAVRRARFDTAGDLWVATGMGLFRLVNDAPQTFQGPHTLLSSDVRDLAVAADGTLWAGGLGGVASYRRGRLRSVLDREDGLPWAEVLCVAHTGSELWVGTRRGVARYDGRRWSLRHSRRWLLDDEVRDIHLTAGPRGEVTARLATAGGVSVIHRRPLTLAAKADHYHSACEARHVRPPGIVEKCRLREPGDLATWEPEDDDNDGGYTALYLAMQSFRFAATRNPEARAQAQRAFDALEFLQRVTETPGFVARTVIPSDWTRMHDPNESPTEPEWAARRVEDPRSKRVPDRWRRSRDGRWLWKGDTSSDEITAHFFGYYYFHELAADTAGRARIRDQVCRIVDHLIAHGFTLVDLDGRPTRWGVWSPHALQHDPDWANESGINAVEILSYLKLAGHVSGDPKYEHHYRALLEAQGYDRLVLLAKNLNPAGRTHIDDELLAFAWPPLLLLERDPARQRLFRRALDQWQQAVRQDRSPFFAFLHAALTGRKPGLEIVVHELRDQPLDLVRWDVDNRWREDVRLVRVPELEHVQTDRLLPPSERGVPRTDENPWRAAQGDGGRTESDGVFWLLPYWMGRHFGFLSGPASGP